MANQSKPQKNEKNDDATSCVGFFAPRTDSAKVNIHVHCTTMSTHVSFQTGSLQSKLYCLFCAYFQCAYKNSFG